MIKVHSSFLPTVFIVNNKESNILLKMVRPLVSLNSSVVPGSNLKLTIYAFSIQKYFVLYLSLYSEKDENKQKEAGFGPYLEKIKAITQTMSNVTISILPSFFIHGMSGCRKTSCDGQATSKKTNFNTKGRSESFSIVHRRSKGKNHFQKLVS